ncbi:acetolactate decarboxylase [Chryseosolibacter indicus]|uniref:Alpha-acetolactate decarboxylase n=1 Tax=Chryseosolibacter indicus TaxID=2782351 RepID=A0ABS5VST8_9BACT|nr:acetolactate decarboxylase [Chryseosolibacter indicus]MBT1704477.1 acetolactate decarboxylase [Chryseosolibacter indicus]
MIRRAFILLILAALITAFIQSQNNDIIYYASLNHAIHEGQFDGVITVNKLKTLGDFGLGSEEKLAGELIILNNEFYSIPSDSNARKMKSNDKLTFASVKKFKPDTTLKITNITDIKSLHALLSRIIHTNSFSAIQIHAKFKTVDFRSFVKQEKPYKPVDEVQEIKFKRADIEGTVVGFYTPKSAEVLNSPNYHFHFIDKDKKTGGHILDCSIVEGRIEVDVAQELHIILPQQENVEHINLNKPLQPK